MRNLKPGQLKALSEFLNTVAAAWFTAGIIAPIFIELKDISKTIVLGLVAFVTSMGFLASSLQLVRKIRL